MADNGYIAESQPPNLAPGTLLGTGEHPPFRLSSLWGPAILNPLNYKSSTLCVLNFRNAYARNFHLFVLPLLLVSSCLIYRGQILARFHGGVVRRHSCNTCAALSDLPAASLSWFAFPPLFPE